MRTLKPFFVQHLAVIHILMWGGFAVAATLDGYFDLPRLGAVPFSVLVLLLGAPLAVAASCFTPARKPVPDNALQNFVRLSPWFLSMLWVLAAFGSVYIFTLKP